MSYMVYSYDRRSGRLTEAGWQVVESLEDHLAAGLPIEQLGEFWGISVEAMYFLRMIAELTRAQVETVTRMSEL